MQEPSRGRSWFGLAAIVGIAAVLAIVAFALRSPAGGETARPLFPNDRMSAWQTASADIKLATADVLVDELAREGRFGPQTLAALAAPDKKRALAEELVAALDAATDQDRKEYVSPGDPLIKTAEAAAIQRGWGK